MGTKIIYHTDPDGYCSAAIASHALWQKDPECQIEYCPMNYGYDIPVIEAEDTVYMLDFSFQPIEHMHDLAFRLGDKFVWIDHHKTSLDYEVGSPDLANIAGARRVTDLRGIPISACELTWNFFYEDVTKFQVPQAATLIGDWDTWRWKRDEKSKAKQFMNGLHLYTLDPRKRQGQEFWDALLFAVPNMVNAVLQQGATVTNYLTKHYRSIMGTDSFEGFFGDHPAIMVNNYANSELFMSHYDSTRHDLMVGFKLVKNKYWIVSLYSTKEYIHCGDIARTLGASEDNLVARGSGGGHAGAAGFQTSWNHIEKLIDIP